jgi:putative tryptophan/tyrosine transport system substrate-binding protein
MMRRREFMSLLGGAAATSAWPFAARGQQGERMRRIGVLTPLAAHDPEHQARLAAFAQQLKHLGWVVGHNLRIDTRSGASDDTRGRRDAAELVALAGLPPASVGRTKIGCKNMPC